jgi:hypothetical protein
MKSTTNTTMKLALLALFASATALTAEISEEDLGAFIRPVDSKSKSLVVDRAKGVVGEIARTAAFAKWNTFEDDKIKFNYPAHEAISVEAVVDKPVPLDEDRVSTVDTSFSRAYRLVAGGETVLVLMLKEADWLDDGICLCGAVVYDRYLVRNGNLYQFSFLQDGILKKMQVLGKGERILMFEWTHLPIHPEIYRRIARSVELRQKGPWTEADCRKRVLERYGPAGTIGWFNLGSTLNSVESVLGSPARKERNGIRIWEYPKNEAGYQWTERLLLPFTDGKLTRFGTQYFDSGDHQRHAIKGDIPWMIKMAEPYDDPPERGAQAKKMPENLKVELLALFLEKKDADAEDFNSLCEVMKILVEQGVNDKRALDVVRRRFASEGGHFAAWVLHKAGHAEDVALFIDKIHELYRKAKKTPAIELGMSDLHNWLAFIPDDDKRYPAILREGLSHSNEYVRESAYYFLDSAPFPQEERIAFVHSGLRDSCARVRYWAARYYAKHTMSKQDWDLLQKAAKREKDEDNLKEMKKVIETQQAKP